LRREFRSVEGKKTKSLNGEGRIGGYENSLRVEGGKATYEGENLGMAKLIGP